MYNKGTSNGQGNKGTNNGNNNAGSYNGNDNQGSNNGNNNGGSMNGNGNIGGSNGNSNGVGNLPYVYLPATGSRPKPAQKLTFPDNYKSMTTLRPRTSPTSKTRHVSHHPATEASEEESYTDMDYETTRPVVVPRGYHHYRYHPFSWRGNTRYYYPGYQDIQMLPRW